MPSSNLGAACTGLWWVRPTDLPDQRGYSWGMNWGTIIFVLVAVAQGYAKWRKKQADEAKRRKQPHPRKRPSVRPNGVRSKQISLPPRSIQPTRHLRPVPRGCRATATPSVAVSDSWPKPGATKPRPVLAPRKRWNSQAKGRRGCLYGPGPSQLLPGTRCGSHFERLRARYWRENHQFERPDRGSGRGAEHAAAASKHLVAELEKAPR